MPTTPLLSIIVPNYNNAQHLPQLLESILAQSLRDLEVVIVDDGSSASYRDILEAYQNRGLSIRLIEHGRRCGTKKARLTGIKAARGRIIAFADADDWLYGTTALEHHAKIMLSENADIVHFNTLDHDNITDIQCLYAWAAPLSPSLDNEEVFKKYVDVQFTSHIVWNKLYSRDLCLKNIDDYSRSETYIWTQEDLYLSTWLFAHAKKYRGSERIGYVYNYHDRDIKRCARAAGRMITNYTMLHDMMPLLQKADLSKEIINKCQQHIIKFLFYNFSHICEKCYPYAGAPFDGAIFQQLVAGENPTVLTKVLSYALTEARKKDNRKATAQQLKACLAELDH